MGVTLRKRGKVWWIFYHHKGQRLQKSTGTGDARIARRVKKRLEEALAEGTDIFGHGDGVPLFEVYADDWLERLAPRLRPGTLAGYRQAIREAEKMVGPRRLTEITRRDARRVVRKLAKKEDGNARDTKTLRNLVNVLHAVFADAMDAEVVKQNPFRDQGRLIQSVAGRRSATEDERSKPRPFTLQEQDQLLQIAQDEDESAPGFRSDYLATLLGLRAGLRRSELLALQRADLDIQECCIHVRRRISRNEIGDPKSKSSRRKVPMTSGLTDAVRVHLTQLDRLAIQEGRTPGATDPIFPAMRRTVDGTGSVDEKRFAQRFRRYLQKANIADRHQPIHQLRHTYASQLLSAGVPTYWVSKWLGHADTRTTEHIYAHWIPRPDEQRVVDLLETGGTFASLADPPNASSRYNGATVDKR